MYKVIEISACIVGQIPAFELHLKVFFLAHHSFLRRIDFQIVNRRAKNEYGASENLIIFSVLLVLVLNRAHRNSQN